MSPESSAKYVDTSQGAALSTLKAGPAVWFVISCIRAYKDDIKAVAYELDVPVEAVEAALDYYRQNPAPIEARIQMNRA